jgi:hypothetical protein
MALRPDRDHGLTVCGGHGAGNTVVTFGLDGVQMFPAFLTGIGVEAAQAVTAARLV